MERSSAILSVDALSICYPIEASTRWKRGSGPDQRFVSSRVIAVEATGMRLRVGAYLHGRILVIQSASLIIHHKESA